MKYKTFLLKNVYLTRPKEATLTVINFKGSDWISFRFSVTSTSLPVSYLLVENKYGMTVPLIFLSSLLETKLTLRQAKYLPDPAFNRMSFVGSLERLNLPFYYIISSLNSVSFCFLIYNMEIVIISLVHFTIFSKNKWTKECLNILKILKKCFTHMLRILFYISILKIVFLF